jgi:predicted RND superfamily exporter protein
MERLESAFGRWVVKWRWCIVLVTAVWVFWSGYGIRFFEFNSDTRVFFSEDNPQLQALEQLENTYNKTDNIIFALAPKNGNVFTRETLAAVEELTEACWKMPHSSRVDSLSNFQHTWADKGDPNEEDELKVEDLYEEAASLTDAQLTRIRATALSEVLLVDRLVSRSGHVTGVNVDILLRGESNEEVSEVAAYARHLSQEYREKYPGIDIYLTGSIMLDNGFGEASRDDLTYLVPGMFGMLILLIGLMLRTVIGMICTLIIILISMLTGMGLAGRLGIALTVASVNAPTIILTLAVADSVHILLTIFHQMRSGKSKSEAISESLRINLQPVFLTSATTAIGFLSMNFSDAPPFRDLGNIVALGVTSAFFYSIFLLPALMAILPVRVKSRTEKINHARCERLANFVIHHRRKVFWGTVLVILVLMAGTLRIELNDDFVKYFDTKYDFRRATDFVQENLTGWDVIEYSLESGEKGGINDPNYLATVEAFANWYRQQFNVVHVNTITDIQKRMNQKMNGDDENYYCLPTDRKLAAENFLVYEMDPPFGLDLNNQINVDRSSTRFTVTLRNMTTRELREMDAKARVWLQANAPPEMFTYGSGLSIIWAHISERNIHSMLGASFGALVLISGILIFALRSFRLGAVSLLPNLAPAFMAFGLWGLTVGQVGLALSVIVALTLGIVVDDTIHFLSKYLRARREYDMNACDAVRYSFHTVGTAMWVTTVVLVAGFLVLLLSGFKVNSEMGLMTAITISLALALDFLFLPTLLMKVDQKTDNTLPKGPISTFEPSESDK